MGKEVEFKIKITEEEFETFLNNRNKIKSFHISDVCSWTHKSDKYYKSVLQDRADNRFVRIRKECTRFARIRNGMIDLLKNTEYDEYPYKTRTLMTIKNKYVDPSTKKLLVKSTGNAMLKAGTEITCKKISKERNGRTWGSYGNCWICLKDASGKMNVKKVKET